MNNVADHTEKNAIGKLTAKIQKYDTTSICRSITYINSGMVDMVVWSPIYSNIIKEMRKEVEDA